MEKVPVGSVQGPDLSAGQLSPRGRRELLAATGTRSCLLWAYEAVEPPALMGRWPWLSQDTMAGGRNTSFIANSQARPSFLPSPVKLPFNCTIDLLSVQGKHFHLGEGYLIFPDSGSLICCCLFWLQKEPDPFAVVLSRKDHFF